MKDKRKRLEERQVRIVCNPQTAGWEHMPLSLDATLVGGAIKNDRFYFGIFGSINGNFYPFVLLRDGRMDFGSEYERDRFAQTNFHGKVISPGELLTAAVPDERGRAEEVVYRVRDIVDM